MPRMRRERGAAAVEFAVVLPVLVAMMVGIMEFGYMFVVQASVSSAARTGVRSYAINYLTSGADTSAKTLAKSAAPDPAKATVTSLTTCAAAGNTTEMVVSYTYSSLTGLFGSTMTLTGTGTMRCGG